jgi:hypothetical protein
LRTYPWDGYEPLIAVILLASTPILAFIIGRDRCGRRASVSARRHYRGVYTKACFRYLAAYYGTLAGSMIILLAIRPAAFVLCALLLFGPLMAILLLAGVRWCEDDVTVDKAHCANCGYDLRGNVSGVCPECGEATPLRSK